MLISSGGIVLNHVRFSENDLIVRVLTEKMGTVSFLVKSGQKNKKKKYLQPLMLINISFYYKPRKNLQYIKDVEFSTVPGKILSNHVKLKSILFLCEVISRCVKEGDKDIYIYNFIEKSLLWLNSNFCSGKHFDIWFLINFTKALGVSPDYSQLKKEGDYFFDPENGSFLLSKQNGHFGFWDLKMSALLQYFLCVNVEELENFSLSYDDSMVLIENVLQYYSTHVSSLNYKKLASIYQELL